MAKLKKQSGKDEIFNRNPLSIALGSFFSNEKYKISRDYKSNDVSRALGIGESLYRMIESGNARIHPKYIFKFISVFAPSNINMDAFCKYLITIQFVDAQMSSLVEFDNALEVLETSSDLKLGALIQSLKPLINAIKSNSPEVKELSNQETILRSVQEFLTAPDEYAKQPQEIQKNKINQLFTELPSIYYAFVGNIIENLLSLPMGFRKDDLWKWEKFNKNNIAYLYAIVHDKSSIIDPKNFATYKYEYLWLEDFHQAHMVFVGDDSKDSLKNDFSDELKKSLIHDSVKLQDFDKKMEKFHFYSSNNKKLINQILKVPGSDNEMYKVAWVFILTTKIAVGIKSKYAGKEFTEFVSLNFDESQELLDQIKQLM